MNVSLMTSEESFMNNCGAALQGYALSRVITDMGHNVQIIRYKGGNPQNTSLYMYLRKRYSKLFRKVFKTPALRKLALVTRPFKAGLKAQKARFSDFQNENMTFWNSKWFDWYLLRRHYPVSDAYVCGSDQIWNPYYKDGYNDLGYFLAFAPAGKRRVAYAPSFACNDIPQTAQHNLKELLDKFDAISVREPEGAAIIKKYAGKDVPVLADPTFLLTQSEWSALARVPEGTPANYILCYRFMKNDEMTKCIERLKEELGLPVITLPLSTVALDDPYEKQFNAGPCEFIGLIKSASLVCTDSFHATAFSLIMNTPFYTFLDNDAKGTGSNMNSRIWNVARLAQLENRVIRQSDDVDIGTACSLDFSASNYNIASFRELSMQWLKKALCEGAYERNPNE